MTATGLTHQIHLPPRLSNDDAVVKLADEEEKSEGGKDASVQPLETPAAVSVKRTSQPIFADEEEKKRMVAQALKRKRDAMKKNNNNNNNNNKQQQQRQSGIRRPAEIETTHDFYAHDERDIRVREVLFRPGRLFRLSQRPAGENEIRARERRRVVERYSTVSAVFSNRRGVE